MVMVKNSILLILFTLLIACAKESKSELNAMEKFFDCLGDSSKCKDIMNKEQKETFEKQIGEND